MNIISIPRGSGIIYKDAKKIIRIEASSNYSIIYCADEKYPITVAKVLQWFQNNLSASDFVRTHRTHLVNKSFIQKSQGNFMLLHNGENICISRRRKNQLK
jgi:two-component system, LytTR family, response regulator